MRGWAAGALPRQRRAVRKPAGETPARPRSLRLRRGLGGTCGYQVSISGRSSTLNDQADLS